MQISTREWDRILSRRSGDSESVVAPRQTSYYDEGKRFRGFYALLRPLASDESSETRTVGRQSCICEKEG